ncbi:MAG: response regulator, partial [Pseudomonadota bacterium]
MTSAEEAQRHLLVVDDDARLRRLLQRYLTEHGHHVSTAADVQEAKAALKNFAFDMMILDVMMPGQDGVSFTTELRERTDLPILLLTARGEVEDRVNGLAVGAD